jgi:primosomal protein N'
MPVARVKRKYYYRLIVKCDKKINIQKLIGQILEKVKITASVQVRVDVDPL